MFNTITYTLEDNATGYVPEAQRPMICDACEQAMIERPNRPVNWKSHWALIQSTSWFTVIDFHGLGTQRCWCCATTRLSGRHLVEMQPKCKAA